VKVALVVPAYGLEVVGGAETAARGIAEHLAARGVTVEVFTTTAVSSRDWADHYPAATVGINGVAVHRFRSVSGRDPDFESESRVVLAQPASASSEVADRWLERQGPRCPAALDALADWQADVDVFSPYLFWPTVHGVRRFAERAVLIPAAHDERPIRLPVFQETFGRAGGLACYTDSERRLVHRLFPATRARPSEVIGLGVDPGEGDPEAAREALGVGARPFLLCLGRVDAGKGTTLLAAWFAAYKQRRPGPLALVFAGPVHQPPPAHRDIVVAGTVTEAVKWGALAAAEVLVNPSPQESLSLVLLEGWLAGRPAIVNGACAVTSDHCRLSGGGVAFTGYATFEAALDRLAGDPTLRAALGGAGRAYVERHYTWTAVGRRYEAFLGHVARIRRASTR
jgi:glycosyltransferase involved in cell wall biosynthesis